MYDKYVHGCMDQVDTTSLISTLVSLNWISPCVSNDYWLWLKTKLYSEQKSRVNELCKIVVFHFPTVKCIVLHPFLTNVYMYPAAHMGKFVHKSKTQDGYIIIQEKMNQRRNPKPEYTELPSHDFMLTRQGLDFVFSM